MSILCSHTKKNGEKSLRKTCEVQNFSIPLHRYPENNLFTLKELIPIEDKAIGCEARRFCFYIYLHFLPFYLFSLLLFITFASRIEIV